MKLITRDTDYAIRSLLFIGEKKQKAVSAKELTGILKIPRPFLRKILQVLNKAGVLESRKGVNGGFILKKDPGQIYLTELMKIYQGPFKLNECLFKKMPCANKSRCVLRKKIGKIEKYVFSQLSSISIGGLLKTGV